MDKKYENKKIEALIEENTFLKKIIRYVPLSIHVLEINEKYETKPYWLTNDYSELTGFNATERENMGFVSPYEFYNEEDVQEIIDATRHLLNGDDSKISVISRFKKPLKNKEWVYIRGAKIPIEKDKHHVVIAIFPINDENVFNQLKLDVYLTEITRLQNQLTIAKLTKTELKIISLLGKGHSTKEVANQLYRSFDTINNHRRSIFKKLEIHKISELVNFARENGLS